MSGLASAPKGEEMNVFADQEKFMRCCGQSVDRMNPKQFAMYVDLIREEVAELEAAQTDEDHLDALLDIIVVCIGAGLSAGFPMEEGWREVMRSNLAKVDAATGRVLRRADGKVIKPQGWQPPNLKRLLEAGRDA